MAPPRRLVSSIALAGAAVACSTAPAGGATDAGADGSAVACPACPEDRGPAPGARCVKRLEVEVRSADGAPMRDFAVQCCGKNLCVYARTNDAGRAVVRVCHVLDAPTFKVQGDRTTPSFAAPLPLADDVTLPAVRLARLPPTGEPIAPAAADAGAAPRVLTSSDVAIEIGPSTTVDVNALFHPEPDDRLFRAVRMAPENLAAGLLPLGERIEVVFGFAPFGTTFAPPAPMTFPNVLGWPPSSGVEVLVHGLDVAEPHAPFGGWRVVSAATVSADGRSIRTREGVPVLSLVGLRKM